MQAWDTSARLMANNIEEKIDESQSDGRQLSLLTYPGYRKQPINETHKQNTEDRHFMAK